LLANHPDRQYITEILHTYFTGPAGNSAVQEEMDEGMEDRFMKIVGNKEKETILTPVQGKAIVYYFGKILKYAAIIACIGLAGWLGFYLVKSATVTNRYAQSAPFSQVMARPGVKTRLVLPDGTEVWLNSGSKLRYQDDFNKAFREVELEGEGFFDVVKDAHHPFIVHTDGIDIKVLGTTFNIKSYPTDKTIEATLLRGMIEVSRKDDPNAPKVILKPNEKLTFNKELVRAKLNLVKDQDAAKTGDASSDIAITPILKNIPDSEKEETSWRYNRLVFDGDSFGELAEKMERWYNVSITFKSDKLLQYRFKGAFDKETIQEALNALKLTAKFRYVTNGNEIMLYDR
jgi:ferric-dicitrate binding protein FerR (iron transport regulator)